MRRLTLVLAVALTVLVFQPATARASTTPVIGAYLAGWNMVGGPAGTDFSGASISWTWNGSTYITPPTTRAGTCQGYWVFFLDPTNVALDSTATGPNQTCVLQAGWNMVGNPFAGAAVLPAGIIGYWWNPDRGAYDLVGAIPPGGSVWIFTTAAANLVLQYQPVATPSPTLLTISNPATTGPFTIHVGDSVKLELPAAFTWTATTNPAFLHIEAAGETGPLSCVGEPSCVLTFANQFWTWHAIASGTTTITAAQLCSATTPCQPPITFQIIILP